MVKWLSKYIIHAINASSISHVFFNRIPIDGFACFCHPIHWGTHSVGSAWCACLVGFRIPDGKTRDPTKKQRPQGVIWGWCRGFVRKRWRVLSQLGFLLWKTKHEKLPSTFFGSFFWKSRHFCCDIIPMWYLELLFGGVVRRNFYFLLSEMYHHHLTQGFLWGAGDSPSLRLPNLPKRNP